MKYLILRKRPVAEEDPFMDPVSAGSRISSGLPFAAETQNLRDHEAAELREDPTIDRVVCSMPFRLIAPVRSQSDCADGGTTWGLDAVGATVSRYDGAGVTVAVLDTGIDKAHPAFAGLPFDREDLMDFIADEDGVAGVAPDTDGHGTHVAATIFGRDVDGTRIGIARGVTRAVIGKILGPQGGTTEGIYNGLEWALRRRADVISMSVGMDFPGHVAALVEEGYPTDVAASRALEDYRSNLRLFDRLAALVAARVMRGKGALLVAASGNASRRTEDPRFTVAVAPPAAADGFISVGAVAPDRTVAYFSNTGCRFAAPGVAILSAKLGGGLEGESGTSMAAPHVAGVLALWTQKLFPEGVRPPGWTQDVESALQVEPVPGQDRNDIGRGIVQAPR